MVADLVKRIRTCSSEERRFIAMQLAETGTDEAASEFIRMVEARHRRGLKWYELSDQLVGVEFLGRTGDPRALGYLNWAYSSECKDVPFSNCAGFYGESVVIDEGTRTITTYPNARGALAGKLSYSHYSGNCHGEDYSLTADKDEQVHQIFSEAIQRLNIVCLNRKEAI